MENANYEIYVNVLRNIYLSRLCSLWWRKLRNRLISSWTRSLVSLRILVNFAAKSGITLAGVFTSLGSSLVIKVGRKRGARQPRDSHVDYRILIERTLLSFVPLIPLVLDPRTSPVRGASPSKSGSIWKLMKLKL